MFRKAARDYGILVLCTLGLIVGFMVYRAYKQDVLDYSLDMIGDRLIGMAGDDANRASVSALYDSFKQRVMAREVPPEQVEHIAANILNLEHSGATLTSTQAEAMLKLSFVSADTPEGVRVRLVEPDRLEALGRRLKSVCDFDEKVCAMIRQQVAAHPDVKQHIHFESEDGIRLSVDPGIDKVMAKREFQRFNRELKRLEKEKMVVWRKNMVREMREARRRLREEMKSLDELKQVYDPDLSMDLKHLEALKELEDLGYHFDEEQLKETIARSLEQVEKSIKEAEDRLMEKSKS